MQNAGRDAMMAAWGVTPQGQKTGHFAGTDGHRVAEVGVGQVGDANGLGEADLHRSAVDPGHARRDGHRRRHQPVGDGPHADHHIAVEHPRRLAGDVGAVHGDVDPLLDLAHRDVRLQQGALEGEAAPDEEADQVVPGVKIFGHIGGFGHQFPRPGRPGSGADRWRYHCPGAKRAKLRWPASATSSSGQALGLRWQNSRKSQARSLGSTTRLPWAYPGAEAGGGTGDFAPADGHPGPGGGEPRRIDDGIHDKRSFTCCSRAARRRAAATAPAGSIQSKATACPGRSWANAGRSAEMTVPILA